MTIRIIIVIIIVTYKILITCKMGNGGMQYDM